LKNHYGAVWAAGETPKWAESHLPETELKYLSCSAMFAHLPQVVQHPWHPTPASLHGAYRAARGGSGKVGKLGSDVRLDVKVPATKPWSNHIADDLASIESTGRELQEQELVFRRGNDSDFSDYKEDGRFV
jgi:hypothetical protein